MNPAFDKWLAGESGSALREAELKFIRKYMRQVVGPVVVQLGEFGGTSLLADYDFPVSIAVTGTGDAGDRNRIADVVSAPEALPFQQAQISSIICPHVLEYSADPHQVLREIKRVLRPEGHIVITGFNPFSLSGAVRLFRRSPPWHGRRISWFRLADWLRLLELEITGSAMFHYRAGLTRESEGRISRMMDSAGDRWWPMLGAVYLVVARKREPGMTMVGREPARLRPKAVPGQSPVRRVSNRREPV